MKTNILLLSLCLTIVLTTACSSKTVVVKSNSPGHIPPGQAKKMTGAQSAKPYAPGQQKKG
jgi:hypothetical protein